MSAGNVKHTNQHAPRQRMFYYGGTATIEKGYVFCFDQDATENSTDPADRLGFTIEKPATANLMFCAGVYSGNEGSFTGPGYITLNIPDRRQPVEAWTDANMVLGASPLAPQDGEWGFGIHLDATVNLAMVAMAGVTENTDTTNALSTVYWL